MQTTLGTTGTNEIQAKLQDANWNDIAEKKIELTVNEASNSVKDAPIAVTKSTSYLLISSWEWTSPP